MFTFSSVTAVIFDLDDTLIHSSLDFAAIKRAINCPKGDDILTFISTLPEDEQSHANQIVLEHEIEDAKHSQWVPGAKEFVDSIIEQNLPMAIVTRNCRQAAQTKVQSNSVPIELIITREDAPAKPDPTALLNIAKLWDLSPDSIAYVGDYIYDTQAAHNANMQAWLYDVSHASEQKLDPDVFSNCLKLIEKPKS